MKNLKITLSNHKRLAANRGEFTLTDFANALLDFALTKVDEGEIFPTGVRMSEKQEAHHSLPTETSKEGAV